MLELPELRTLIRSFIEIDMRHRVDKMVTELRLDRQSVLWARSDSATGVVSEKSNLPVFTTSWGEDFEPWHFVKDGLFHWFNIPLRSGEEWKGYDKPSCTYRRSVTLDHALWCEYGRDPVGPRVPFGHTLETIGDQAETYKLLKDNGVRVTLSYYQKDGDTVSVARQLASSFVRRVEIPGTNEVFEFNHLETQLRALHVLREQSGAEEGSSVVEDKERDQFLGLLKSECGVIKAERGPFAAKAAFDLMKYAARILDDSELKLRLASG